MQEAPELLIKSPAHAKELFGFITPEFFEYSKEEIQRRLGELQAAHSESLLYVYFSAEPSRKGAGRKFKELDEIKTFARKCDALVESQDPTLQRLNTLFILSWLKDLKTSATTFQKCLAYFVSRNFDVADVRPGYSKMCALKIAELQKKLSEKGRLIFQCELDSPGKGVALARLCEKFKPSTDTGTQNLRSISFLGALLYQLDPKFSSEAHQQNIANFIFHYFKTPNNNVDQMEEAVVALMNALNEKLPEAKRFFPFYNKKGEKMTFIEGIVNDISEKPNLKNLDEILRRVNPGLVVSLVKKREVNHHFRSRKTLSQPFWASHCVKNIIIEVPDFGKPHSDNPDFTKNGAVALITTYKDFYYGGVALAEAMNRGETTLAHCKAGKGRSVTFVLAFLRAVRLGLIDCEKIDPLIPTETKDILMYMLAKRFQIDSGDDTIRCADDFIDFVKEHRQKLEKTTPFKYFLTRYDVASTLGENSNNDQAAAPAADPVYKSPSLRKSHEDIIDSL
jgi:hypothetical protein